MTERSSLTYRDAGVDIDAGEALVERIKPKVARTLRPEVLAGIGALVDSSHNWVVSAQLFAGGSLPLVENANLRLTLDVTPALTYVYSAPVNLFSIGLLAGLRIVHSTGFTIALRLPLIGYAGSFEPSRGSLYYYYISAIPTVPVLNPVACAPIVALSSPP